MTRIEANYTKRITRIALKQYALKFKRAFPEIHDNAEFNTGSFEVIYGLSYKGSDNFGSRFDFYNDRIKEYKVSIKFSA